MHLDKPIVKSLIFIGLLAAAIATYINQDPLLAFLQSQIIYEPSLKILAIAVLLISLMILLLVPASIVFVTTGAILGVGAGFTANLIGFSIGSTAAFLISRYIAGDIIERRSHLYIERLNTLASKEGWLFIAVVRLTPIMPSFIVNYLLGLTRVSTRDYCVGTAIFIIPSCLFLTYAGSSVRAIVLLEQDQAFEIYTVTSVLLFLGFSGLLIKRRLRNKLN